MPIVGRTARECFKVFEKHLSGLVAATVTRQPPLMGLEGRNNRISMSFRSGDRIAAPIDTAHGRLYRYLNQALEAIEENRLYRLQTRKYWYGLQSSPDFDTEAVIRWEYDSAIARHRHARHHAHIGTCRPAG